MALSAVELYERLKPHLGEGETKALIEYVDGKIRGEVATKEDLLLVKGDLEGKIQEVREEIHEVREEIHGVQVSLEAKIQGVRDELVGKIQGVKDELKAEIQGVREEVWKLRVLVIVVLVVVIVLNPKVLELVGRILGVTK